MIRASVVGSRARRWGRREPRGRNVISMTRRQCSTGIAVVWLAAVVLGCGTDPTPSELVGEPRCEELRVEAPLHDGNLIIVLNDTMRRDFVGAYGGAASTPRFDAFAAEHLLFEHVITQAPWTKPSIATLFTSLYPSQHQVATHSQLRRGAAADEVAQEAAGAAGDEPVESDVLAPSLETLAEVLQRSGMRTAAFVSNPWMVRPFGFDQGFEVYDDSFARWGADGDQVIERGLAWLDSLEEGERFFLYLHTIDTHRPYGRIPEDDIERRRRQSNAGRPLTSPEGRAFARTLRLEGGQPALEVGFAPTDALVRAAYRSGVERFDAVFGRLLDALAERRSDWDRTALVVTSDHGEALYERGYGNHGRGLFDEETGVPLAARLPGVAPARARVECLVGLVDLMPSLCDYLGAECPSIAQGWSFLRPPGATPTSERRLLVSESAMDEPARRSVRNRRFKLVFSPGDAATGREASYSLFDLERDPAEEFDRLAHGYRSAETDGAYRALRAALPEAVAALPAPERSAAEIDPELHRRLEAIGYTE